MSDLKAKRSNKVRFRDGRKTDTHKRPSIFKVLVLLVVIG